MTDSEKPAQGKTSLSKQDIINWLQDNPDFLNQNPELYDALTPPQETQGKGIADFQYYMVQRLKDDKDQVVRSAQDLVETSRLNMSNQNRIHAAVLMMLEAQSFEDLIHVITMDIATLMGVDIISLIVETDGQVVPHIDIQGVRAVTPGTVSLLTNGNMICLEDNIKGYDELYGGGAGLVKSQLLLTLDVGQDSPPAMIAFGCRDPQMFEPGQATDLIKFFGRVAERCFCLWLDLPGQG